LVFQANLDRELAGAVRRGLVVDEDFERGIPRAVRFVTDAALLAAVIALAVTLEYVSRSSVTPAVHVAVRLCLKHLHLASGH
jgi:hypothetical protein